MVKNLIDGRSTLLRSRHYGRGQLVPQVTEVAGMRPTNELG